MRRYWMLRKGRFVLLAAVAIAVFGLIVMGLWNWLMPVLFGWPEIGFWQAVALLVLSKILFGGFRGPWGHGMHWRHRMQERWERMTPEEREKFQTGFRGHCGHRHEPAQSAAPVD
jgi:hypothetical protein